MNTPLLETKLLAPPLQSGLVARPRLVGRLAAGGGGKLALVCAPPGFGKTTLLGEWARTAGGVAWLALDESDNDPVRFLVYLVGAFQKVQAGLGQASLACLLAPAVPGMGTARPEPDDVPGEACLAALLNEILAAGRPLALVLDDYHLIQAEPVHQVLRYFLEHQPPQLQIVVSTRQDPPLPLARLRARGHLVEIRARDLRFGLEEAADFLQARLGARPAQEALALLAERTEGWAAGLQLAALSMQEADQPLAGSLQADSAEAFLAGFAGDNRHIADYLFEEVFQRQPGDVQDFLLHTAILERASAPLAAALLGGWLPVSAQGMLERIEAAQLFLVPLDANRHWYRYHPLFRDLLRRLLDERYPGRAAELHRRASQWYEQAAQGGGTGTAAEQAIEHALAIPDPARAAVLVEQCGSLLLYGGQIATFLGWIGRLPEDEIFRHPYLCLDCGWAHAFRGQERLAERFAQAGEACLVGFGSISVSGRDHPISGDEIRGDLTALRAFCARVRGDTPAVIHYSELALEQLPAEAQTVRGAVALNLGLLYAHLWDWDRAQRTLAQAAEMALASGENPFVAGMALSMQGKVYEQQGRLDQAVQAYQQAIDMDLRQRKVIDPIPAAGIGYLGLGQVSYYRGEIDAAVEHLARGRELARLAGNAEIGLAVQLLQARLALLAGDLGEAGRVLDQAGPEVRRLHLPHYEAEWSLLRAEHHLARGDMEAAVKLLESRKIQPVDLPAGLPVGPDAAEEQAWLAEQTRLAGLWDRFGEYLLLARLLWLQQWDRQAAALLEQLAPLAEASRSLNFRLETRLLRSLVSARQKNPGRALELMEEALALAAPQGFASPFLRLGALMAALLRQAAQPGGRQSDYAQAIQAALAGRTHPVQAGGAQGEGVEALTQRERQVLRLLAAGLNSSQVAEELVISVSTARSYIKAIYTKLNAHSREEALAQGRAAGLVR